MTEWVRETGGFQNDGDGAVDLKDIHNLKGKSYVLFSRNVEDFKPGRQYLKDPERSALRRLGKKPG